MATGEPDRYGSPVGAGRHPATVARRVQRFGLVVVLVGVLPVLATGAVVFARWGGGGVVAAVTTDVGGVASAFRVAVTVTAAGCWCIGLGMLAEGLLAPRG